MNTKIKFGILALTISIILILTAYPATQAVGLSQNALRTTNTPVLAQSSNSSTPEPLILTDGQSEYPLGLHLDILEDSSGKLTIAQVSSPEFDSQFTPSQVEVPNYGFSNSAYWVRVQLDNETRQIDEWLLELGFANMHYIDLYTPLLDGKGFSVKQTGSLRPVSTRDLLYPHFVFDLSVPTQSQQTYYLRFQSGASMTLGLTLWTKEAFWIQSQWVQMLNWLFFGALIALLLYHLFLLFTLREASYLIFVILLASLLFEELSYDGYLETYLIPSLYRFKSIYFPWSFSLIIVSIVIFSDVFLELSTRIAKLHWANILFVAGWGALILLTPFISYHYMALLMTPWALISLAATWVAGIATWRQGFKPARFFMIAWFGLLASLILVLLVRLGIAPSTLFSENLYRVGMIWMAVCWSIALADRINLLIAKAESANRDLRNSEHRLSQILEGLPLGVILYGKDHKPKYANQRTVELLSNPAQGIRPDISAGRTLAQAIPYFSLRLAGSQQEYPLEEFPVFTALQGEPAFADDVEMDRGDERVNLEIQASPVRDDAGNVESAVVAIQDVTRRKQAEAELVEHRKHLENLVIERTTELNTVNEQLRLRLSWLSAVNKVHLTIAGKASLAAAYEELSAKIIHTLGAALIFILRWEDKGEQSEVFGYSLGDTSPEGRFNSEIEIMQAAFQKDSPLRREVELGKMMTWYADQAAELPGPLGECFQGHDIQLSVLTPMIIRQSVIGVLIVAASMPSQDFILQQLDLVERMTFDLSSLTQDAILLDQALVLATIDERNRLARDLHDSVTQVLFSASLLAEVLPQIWRRDPEQGLKKLEKLRQLTRGALAEMRTMLLELRPTAVINTPLSDLLAQLAMATTSRSGLQFQLFIEQIPSLPENVQINFYRIAQEALSNIVKHAQATLVIMSLRNTPLTADLVDGDRYELNLTIQDDGVGFSSEKKRSDQLGINIMHERAAAIQASLTLESRVGYGTQMTLIWCSEIVGVDGIDPAEKQ
jgi:signal transduction histidine kinase/PAS domain-containing protein